MKLMGKRAAILMALCLLFTFGLSFFLYSYVRDAAAWATYPVNRHLYRNGRLVSAGDIYDRNGDVLAASENGARRYHGDGAVRRAVMHLVGDADGNVATGLQVSYRSTLTGWNVFTGAYSFDQGGGRSITTTADAPLCKAAYEALNGRRGTVGVMNYRTGEILCMVSSPSFDPTKPPDVNDPKYEGVYLNRLLSASFVPGSIFKLVTAAAALEQLSGLPDRVFVCDGLLELDGGRITCPRTHGTQDFGQTLTNSCNVAFAELALDLGPAKLTQYAERAGFNSQNMQMDNISVAGGSFTLDGAREADIGWAGVGQHKSLVNPLTYMQFVGSVAHGGQRVKPHIIKGTGVGFLTVPRLAFSASAGRSMSAGTADALKGMMRDNVLNNYGEGKLGGYNLCGKTGTAEVGGGLKPHSWFVGFLDSDKAPLCFAVLVENGGAGSAAAAGVAKTVLAQAVKGIRD